MGPSHRTWPHLVAALILSIAVTQIHTAPSPENYVGQPESGDGTPENPFVYKVNQGQGIIVETPPDLVGYKKVTWQSLGGIQKGATQGTRTADSRVIRVIDGE